jgi:hypothetical protein
MPGIFIQSIFHNIMAQRSYSFLNDLYMIQIRRYIDLCRTACILYTCLWISYTACSLIGADLIRKIVIRPELIGTIVTHPRASCASANAKANTPILDCRCMQRRQCGRYLCNFALLSLDESK